MNSQVDEFVSYNYGNEELKYSQAHQLKNLKVQKLTSPPPSSQSYLCSEQRLFPASG